MARYKGILFDNDGTLVDTELLILESMRYSTRKVLGRTIPDEELMRKVGQPLAVQMRDFTDDVALQEEVLRVYRTYNHAHHDQVVKAFSGVARGLAQLAEAGCVLGVVTSKLHALAWRGLETTGLSPYLACCIGADDCDRFKPDPAPVVLGCQSIGLDPSDCLYVGDSPFDLQAGNGAGCDTAAALGGMFGADELRAESPTFECATFDELVAKVLG